ncbi:MAG: hypothetical protein J5I98_34490, partial [Phaeodactylibacter sp.]|nr:hypothetical protein [Phaeodactylibacter sp.]
ILGSHEGIFPPHSSATGRKNGKVRFQKLAFTAKMTTSKHALNEFYHLRSAGQLLYSREHQSLLI